MFERQIQQASELIRRVRLCSDKGLECVPISEHVSLVELEAWYSSTRELITHAFGRNATELYRFELTIKARNVLSDEARDRGDPKWSYTYWIEHFLQMTSLLQEFEARWEAVQAERRPPIQEIIMGDKYAFGNITGSIVNVDSVLSQVTQNIGSLGTVDETSRKQLTELIEQLKTELHKAPPEKRDEAEAIADSAKALVEAGTKAKPNRTTLQITAEGLKKAAESVAEVMPTVLTVASSIVRFVFQLSGSPIP